MTDTAITVMVTGFTTTLATLATFIVSIRNGKKAADTLTKAEETSAKADKIQGAVDGNLSEVKAALAAAIRKSEEIEKRSARLETMLVELIGSRANVENEISPDDRRKEDVSKPRETPLEKKP